VGGGSGTGWVVAPDRFADECARGQQRALSHGGKRGRPEEIHRHVVHIAHDCDLALLKVDDPAS